MLLISEMKMCRLLYAVASKELVLGNLIFFVWFPKMRNGFRIGPFTCFMSVCRWIGFLLPTGSPQSSGHPHWTSLLKVQYFSPIGYFSSFYLEFVPFTRFISFIVFLWSLILLQCDKGVENAPWLDDPSSTYCVRRRDAHWINSCVFLIIIFQLYGYARALKLWSASYDCVCISIAVIFGLGGKQCI